MNNEMSHDMNNGMGMNYQQQSLQGATGLEVVVALYDAAIRFLHQAIRAVEENDVIGRRIAIKKVVDILMYLQARLRPDVGGTPALALADFYAAMFTMTLEASHIASTEQLLEVIACVRNVRDAWSIAALDPAAGRLLPRELRTHEEKFLPSSAPAPSANDEPVASRWSA
jgi:flagellar protein FliS